MLNCLETWTLLRPSLARSNCSSILWGSIVQDQSVCTCRVTSVCKVLNSPHSAFIKTKQFFLNIQELLLINDSTSFQFFFINVFLYSNLLRCFSREYSPIRLESVTLLGGFLSLVLDWYLIITAEQCPWSVPWATRVVKDVSDLDNRRNNGPYQDPIFITSLLSGWHRCSTNLIRLREGPMNPIGSLTRKYMFLFSI